MKIGFIGLGNMATAMIGGMLQKGIAKPEDIIGSSKTETTAEKVKTQQQTILPWLSRQISCS